MEKVVFLFGVLPFLGFVIALLLPAKNERTLALTASILIGTQLMLITSFLIYWVLNGQPLVYEKGLEFRITEDFSFFIDAYFDWTTATYLFVGAFLAFLISRYSENYLHREQGFKRFFTTILFFYWGYNIIVISGNFSTMFIGWEIAGVASFLLIAYYRNRYLPVKNAVKIFSIYRLGDIAILMALWSIHHLWHKNVSFLELNEFSFLCSLEGTDKILGLVLSFSLIFAAWIKSSQFPFFTWLARAMEGPTPSSAIFYSSLSVHIGVLMLLRTYPIWHVFPLAKIFIISFGVVTFLLANLIMRSQPSIKGQIAYACIAQVSLMFIEVALDLHTLVLVHFAGNAFLRSYQLLISPSIVTYSIREQFYYFTPTAIRNKVTLVDKIGRSMYILALKELNVEKIIYKGFWNLLKSVGKFLPQISLKKGVFISFTICCIAVLGHANQFGSIMLASIELIAAFGAIVLSLKAFVEKKNIYLPITFTLASYFIIASSILDLEMENFMGLLLYLGGGILSFSVCVFTLKRLDTLESKVSLMTYQGHCFEHPKIETIFLLGALGLFGFPITSSFLGLDLVLAELHPHDWAHLALVFVVLIINGIAMIRIYARIFLGPHVKTYHESARRTS